MDIYRELILDHYKNPRNFGHLPKASASAEEYNATCGDRIRMEIKIKSQQSLRKDSGQAKVKIEDIRFSGEGCAISQASASMLTEKVKGMSNSQVMRLTTSNVLDMLGTTLTPLRLKCAVLPLEVLQKALEKDAKPGVQ